MAGHSTGDPTLSAALAAAATDSRVQHELRGQVLWVRIEREAQHNALALSMLDNLAALFRAAAAHLRRYPAALKLAVIMGAGDRSFAAGGDLRELDAVRTEPATRAMSTRGMTALNAIRDFSQPVVAALNGAARGGGAELALACDWRVAHRDVRFGLIQGQLALSTAWGGGTDLMQRLGTGRAMELLGKADLLSASEAAELGLIERVLDGDAADFRSAFERYLSPLLEHPPAVLAAHKALAQRLTIDQREALQRVETARLVDTWTSDEHWQRAEGALKR